MAPLDGAAARAMYLPPNAAANAAFLETLRLALVHETPHGVVISPTRRRVLLAPAGRPRRGHERSDRLRAGLVRDRTPRTLRRRDRSNLEQTYLSVATDVKWKKDQDLNLSLAYGKSLSKAEPDFGQVELALTKELGFNNDRLIINLGGGLASKETPLNYQFKGGGNSRIPLRGHKYNLAGTRYLSGNAEFHKFLGSFWYYGWYNLWGFVFIDCARFSQADSIFSDLPYEIDGGSRKCGL